MAEGEDDAERLDLADRERADAVFERQLPAAAKFVDQLGVPGRVEGGGVGDHLPDAHPGVAHYLLRGRSPRRDLVSADRCQASSPQRWAVPPVARSRPECALDERRFAAAVLAEQAEDGAGFDFEIDASEDFFVEEVFLELVDFDHGRIWKEGVHGMKN